MEEKFTPNNIDKGEFIFNNKENDYKNLITRLKQINLTIVLLKKKYLDKL